MPHHDAGSESLGKRLLTLFVTIFSISATANSGFAILSVMKDEFVRKRGWFSEDQMADFIAIVQSTPGAMAVNASMVVGYQVAGPLGSLVAVTGCILPPMVVMIVVTAFYEVIVGNEFVYLFMRGMQLGVVGMLLDVLLSLFANVTKKGFVYPLVLVAVAFVYIRFLGWPIPYLAIGCALAGVVKALLFCREASR
ncbi:MAG: chromate transporter [Atopobiaceae bacterium]|nr:chromate transporter [Atopobiaceae bacterium]